MATMNYKISFLLILNQSMFYNIQQEEILLNKQRSKKVKKHSEVNFDQALLVFHVVWLIVNDLDFI